MPNSPYTQGLSPKRACPPQVDQPQVQQVHVRVLLLLLRVLLLLMGTLQRPRHQSVVGSVNPVQRWTASHLQAQARQEGVALPEAVGD